MALGRPRKPPQDRRTRRAVVKFSPTEWERTLRRANEVGLTLGPFLRRLGLEKRLPMPRSDKEAMTELKRIGNNLNQLTRAINRQYPVAERHIEIVLELAAAAIRKIAR